MSILNVEHLTHGFGDRAIFTDVSFRLLKESISGWSEQMEKESPLYEYCHGKACRMRER